MKTQNYVTQPRISVLKLANYFMYDVIFKRCQNSNSLFCHGRADEASSGLKFKSRLSSEIGLVYWISNKPYSRESRMLTFILKKATKLAYHLGVLNWLTLIHRFIN